MPKSWGIKRKNIKFISKPNPGSYNRKYITSFLILIRDIFGYVKSSKEAKYILFNSEVLVNGKKITDIKSPIGFFDIVEFKKSGEKFTIIFDELGKIKIIDKKDDNIPLKLKSKKVLGTKKFQLNFLNSFNFICDEKTFKKIKCQDTAIYDISKKKIVEILPLTEKSQIYIFDGKYKGKFGIVKEFDLYNGKALDKAVIIINKEEHTTSKNYLFCIKEVLK